MKLTLKIEKEFEVKYLLAKVGARYWEDATVDGVEDVNGDLIPCREDDCWCPKIDVDSGVIVNWAKGVKADIHYKSCDNNEFTLLDEDGEEIKTIDGYVINMMCPEENGYGDYVIMKVDEDGQIGNWNPTFSEFNDED